MKNLWLVPVLAVLAFYTVGCNQQPAQSAEIPLPSPTPPPVAVPPAEGPRWFPENLRWLTDGEKNRAIEIALKTPSVLEQLQKETQYKTAIGWIVLSRNTSGGGYSGYSKSEYEIVSTGIRTNNSGDLGPLGDTKNAELYPNVTIWFGDPNNWVVSVAVDLKAERVVFEESYPGRKAPPVPPN